MYCWQEEELSRGLTEYQTFNSVKHTHTIIQPRQCVCSFLFFGYEMLRCWFLWKMYYSPHKSSYSARLYKMCLCIFASAERNSIMNIENLQRINLCQYTKSIIFHGIFIIVLRLWRYYGIDFRIKLFHRPEHRSSPVSGCEITWNKTKRRRMGDCDFITVANSNAIELQMLFILFIYNRQYRHLFTYQIQI